MTETGGGTCIQMERVSAIVALAATLSPGNLDHLRRILPEVVPVPLPPIVAYEILLQSLLFFGFAQAIEAAKVFAEVVPLEKGDGGFAPVDDAGIEERQRRGRALGEKIYYPNFERLMSNLGKVSPELAEWMVEDGYSKVLSRPGPTALEREIASIVFLTISGHPVQLHSHLRGARNLGATPDSIRSVLGNGVLSRKQMDVVDTKIEQVFRK
jgi:alkylhydroperoxidase/carboxymuconolactone decarboxylase family protein YurZ